MTDNHQDQIPVEGAAAPAPIYTDDLPAGCPLDDAVLEDAVFYAAHKENPPSDSDFTTAFNRNAYKKDHECERKCNSVMSEESDAKHLIQAVPARYRFVSRGRVHAAHGAW